jgi:hypothetical protein
MLTDAPLRNSNRAGFIESEGIRTLDLPQDGCLLAIAKSIESAMNGGQSAAVRRACAEFLAASSRFYNVPNCAASACSQPDHCECAKTRPPLTECPCQIVRWCAQFAVQSYRSRRSGGMPWLK